jgi:hypothetical protein
LLVVVVVVKLVVVQVDIAHQLLEKLLVAVHPLELK